MASTESPSPERGEEMRKHSRVSVSVPGLASEEDAEVLAKMGYKQELKRSFNALEIFGIAFSIMGLLPSIASTLAFSIPAGPVGLVWGWFIASGLIFVVGLAMAELAARCPRLEVRLPERLQEEKLTRLQLYFWTHYYASPKTRNALSFLVGYSNTLGLIGGICSIDYGFALQFLAVIVIARDGNWVPSNGIIYAVFLCTVLLHGLIASTMSKIMAKLQSVSSFMQFALILATIIALPVGNKFPHDGAYIFTKVSNLTTWPDGWAFILAWLSPIWTIGAFDSCVHLSEEATNATKAVPMGILMSIGCCWLFGWVCVIVIAACIDPELSNVVGSKFGQPMAQIYFDALGKNGAMGFMALLMICQFMMGISIVVAASRQSWAFSRDGALPFSTFFRRVSSTFGYIPFRAVWGCAFGAAVLGLLTLIDVTAAAAVFSLAVAGNNLAWLLPIFARVWWGQSRFTPGPFHLGRLSLPVAWLAIAFLVFGIVLSMFPVGGPNPTPDAMNYTCLINGVIWAGALGYYFLDARKWFTGPKVTIVESESLTEEQEVKMREEGLLVGDKGAVKEGKV